MKDFHVNGPQTDRSELQSKLAEQERGKVCWICSHKNTNFQSFKYPADYDSTPKTYIDQAVDPAPNLLKVAPTTEEGN